MVRDAVLVFVTCASAKEAARISNILVSKKIAACANILPDVRSIFRWDEKITNAREVLVMIKTRASKFAALDKEVRLLHSYEVPEIIAIPIISGSVRYLNWIADSLKA